MEANDSSVLGKRRSDHEDHDGRIEARFDAGLRANQEEAAHRHTLLVGVLPTLLLQCRGASPDALSWGAVVRDPDGVAQAYGARRQRERWIAVPGAAHFRFLLGGNKVDGFPIDSAPHQMVLDAYYGTALPLVLQAQGFEALHASAVETSRGVSAFCAISGVGKSTLATALSRRGHGFWADDVVLLEPRLNARVLCRRLPPVPGLEAHASEVPGRDRSSGVAPLAALALLGRHAAKGQHVIVRRLPIGEAFARVLEHAHSFDPSDRDRRRAMSANYLQVVGDVPVFEVSFRPGARYFDAVIETVEETVLAGR